VFIPQTLPLPHIFYFSVCEEIKIIFFKGKMVAQSWKFQGKIFLGGK